MMQLGMTLQKEEQYINNKQKKLLRQYMTPTFLSTHPYTKASISHMLITTEFSKLFLHIIPTSVTTKQSDTTYV